jgi:maltose alpha-D-glucosyltransferase/alpha-amylase
MMDLPNGIRDLLIGSARAWLEDKILPTYLRQRRWFASKDKRIELVRIERASVVAFEQGDLLFAEIEVQLEGAFERYQLVMGLCTKHEGDSSLVTRLKLADVSWNGRPAVLTDAFALDVLPLGLMGAIKSEAALEVEDGEIRCLALPGLAKISVSDQPDIRRISAEQSNSSVILGDMMIMKIIRRVMYGTNPEVEMVRYLTENEYANTPPLLGEVRRIDAQGAACSMAVVQQFVANEGDAWEWTLNHLREGSPNGYNRFAAAMGTRLAQLHEVLAKPADSDAFRPHEADEWEVAAWANGAKTQLQAALLTLEKAEIADSSDAASILEKRDAILDVLPKLAAAGVGSLVTRIHGDFHLGQILVSNEDAFIIDFEGEPAKPLEVRRAKSSPMRDVAGLLRSLHYAAATIGASSEDFVQTSSCAFLDAYRLVERSARWRWISSVQQGTDLLDLFLLEKAAYEICYESANRPSWLPIPVRGFAAIVQRVLGLAPETENA